MSRLVWLLVRARACAALPLVWLILDDRWAVALGLLALCAVSDWADGWVARRWRAGALIHPLDDCLADTVVLFAGLLACVWQGLLPPVAAPVVLAGFAFYLVTLPAYPGPNPLGKGWGPVLTVALGLALAAPPAFAGAFGGIALPVFAVAVAVERSALILRRDRGHRALRSSVAR